MNTSFTIESQRKFLTALADSSNIQVIWDPKCKVPNATGAGVITLPPPGIDDVDIWLYHAHHEISHLFSENMWNYQILKDIKDELEMSVANCIMDYIAERSRWGEYAGRDEIMDKGRALSMQQLCKSYEGLPNLTPEINLLHSLTRADHICRQQWDGTPNLKLVEVPSISPEADELFQKITNLSLGDRMDSCDNIQDLHALVDDILKLIGRESEGAKSGGAEGEEGEGAEGKAEGKGGRAEGEEGKEAESKSKAPSGKKVDAPSCIPSSIQIKGLQEITVATEDQMNKTLDFSTRKYIPHHRHAVRSISGDNTRSSLLPKIIQVFEQSTLTKQVKKHLMALTSSHFEYGKKKGVLSPRGMHKIFTADRDPTIFKERSASHIKGDTAVSLLVDCSGSMGGSKYVTAAAAAVSLSSVLSNLRIKHEILGFTEDHDELRTYVIKEFTEVCPASTLLARVSSSEIRLGNNCDGESLTYAAGRLLQRKEKNKVMIVLSDGYPCSYLSGDPHWYLKRVCEKIEKETPIYLVGLGIESRSVREYYSNYHVITNINELNAAVLTTLKNNILR